MTAAALLFDPAAAPTPASSPALPRSDAPVGDFAGMMEGRLSSRSQPGQGTEVATEVPPAEDMDLEPDLVLCHRPSLLTTPFTPTAVPPGTVSETETELVSFPLMEVAVETVPPVPEGVQAELIAGCWVWPVPVPAETLSEAAVGEALPGKSASKGGNAPAALPVATTMGQKAATVETPVSAEKAATPATLLPTATSAVVLDPAQWQAVATATPQLQGTAERALPGAKPGEPASQPMASKELVAAVASVLEQAVEGRTDGHPGDPGPGNPSPQGQELPDRKGLNGPVEAKFEAKTALFSGKPEVSSSGISTARELNRMNTATLPVETAEPKGQPVSAILPPSAPVRVVPELADLAAQWHPSGLPAAFVAISQAQDVGPVQSADQVRQIERIEATERLKAVVSHEVQVLKSAGAGSLAVMLRPNADTELFVQLTRQGDRIEAFVRVEKGDSAEFRQGWERLQASLATQQVKLLPLQSSDFQQQPQRQSAQHEGHDFNEPRGGFRDEPGFGREQRGDRGTREERSPFSIETHDRKPSRSIHPRRAVAGNGRTLETWA